jgi:hypothetical protein
VLLRDCLRLGTAMTVSSLFSGVMRGADFSVAQAPGCWVSLVKS